MIWGYPLFLEGHPYVGDHLIIFHFHEASFTHEKSRPYPAEGDFMSTNKSSSLADFTPEICWFHCFPWVFALPHFRYKRDVFLDLKKIESVSFPTEPWGGKVCLLPKTRFGFLKVSKGDESSPHIKTVSKIVRYELCPGRISVLGCTPSSSIITMAGHQYPTANGRRRYCGNQPPVTVDSRPVTLVRLIFPFWVLSW